ncbi:hypothetical protein BC831DRAFT_448828 [Entophlyctis helioformis]|nr:hypothetical protein BC831DRAFT_448828 [Entophlyctis helioformis]
MSATAITLSSYGVDKLTVSEVARPTAGPNQVVVNVKLRPVNPADVFSVLGVYPGFAPKTLPATPGLEGYGIVTEVGPGVTRVAVGARVVPFFDTLNGHGSWQEFVVVDEQELAIVPDSVSDATAAQLIVNPISVLGMLDRLAVPKGEFVLQSAAGSTLGRQLIQIAKSRGIKTVNLVRRSAQIDELKAIGADVVVSTEGLDTPAKITAAILEATGGKHPYGAVDAVGGNITEALTLAVRVGGTVIVYGAMEGMSCSAGVGSLIFRGITITGYWLGKEFPLMGVKGRQAITSEALDLITRGVLEPFSGEIFPLADIGAAVGKSMAAARGGKVLVA